MAKNAVAPLMNLSTLMEQHGPVLQQLGITAHSFNTMKVVQVTRQRKQDLEFLEKEKADLSANIVSVDKEIKKALAVLEAAYTKKSLVAFKVFAKAAKIGRPKVSTHISITTGGKKLSVSTEYSQQERYHQSLDVVTLVKLPANIKKLQDKGSALIAKRTKVTDEILTTRIALQNVGEMEREANAYTTHAMLTQTPAGKQLLSALGLEDL